MAPVGSVDFILYFNINKNKIKYKFEVKTEIYIKK